ncbi:MAG: ATPase [Bdellovibrionales bacterium RIFOXYB1_FULL_37_110]|nr:MAG: ATPase [Bdellovibrionales bacterium RIFOXYA1_FULL_38_20]OFZ51169.1 MAG: ATPase [Bdellovibrionales bacterium RIFOXYC1_FULL_37_79]OFZ61275.1 MAG: ATPase [Bdellovibrionales bacterium RIFOXYB1_FULL_37_110]OFZ62138.1 MAG: ATPase [Bdellovibrionales bacterium RIFOXYD1_FULL_36_51]OFZ67042.1 MAG: ATPase [Bdellovibrionales bacterium RIFOXYB2_FULL_36_6]
MAFDAREKIDNVLQNASKMVFGQDWMLEAIMAALICEGHLLIEGMPGLGKTLAVSVMSKLCDLSFKRVQFTPDLLPSDLIGTMIYSQKSETFSTKFGPLFTQILLADEINRSPAKVQAALLEGMAERQVTIGETTYPLTRPFVVLATQNPIDQEGTYPLPEAQLDRFMMKIKVDYPSLEAELKILDLKKETIAQTKNILNPTEIEKIAEVVEGIYVDPKIKNLIVKLVHSTRPDCPTFPKRLQGAVLAGASPRASIWLYKIGKFMAFMDGKDFVSPDHLFKIIPSVLGHRIILTYEATVDNLQSGKVALEIASSLV